jgi:PTS system nitrogen regulatory IIA component
VVLAIQEQTNKDKKNFFPWLKKKKEIKISNYLEKEICFFKTSSRDEAIEILVSNLEKTGKLTEKDRFHKAILEREKIVSTGIGMGVAIPHAKLPSFKNFFIAMGIQKDKGIEWDAIDKAPVRLIFMIGGPEEKQNEYLQILSHLTVIVKDEMLRKKLINAEKAEEVIKLLSPF